MCLRLVVLLTFSRLTIVPVHMSGLCLKTSKCFKKLLNQLDQANTAYEIQEMEAIKLDEARRNYHVVLCSMSMT